MWLALGSNRCPIDVVLDLEEAGSNSEAIVEQNDADGSFRYGIWLLLLCVGSQVCSLVYCFGRIGIAVGLFIAALGVLLRGAYIARSKSKPVEKIEKYLPLFIEQLVMYAQSGKDVAGCIESVVANEFNSVNYPQGLVDTFERVVSRSHKGVAFSDCLRHGANEATSPLVKYVLVYLLGAYRDGTDVCSMLTELSDATQQLVEDRAEERIARLPALATVPLIVSFSGLLIIFLSIPLLRILGQLKEHAL